MELKFLVNYLLDERGETLKDYDGFDYFSLYRVLVNERPPKEVSAEYLENEDKVLENINSKPITINSDNKIILHNGDITKLKVDTIVNPANCGGTGCYVPLHNCLDNQIGTKAGVRLRLECSKKMEKKKYLKTSECFLTDAYNLPCSHIIHAVGPIVEEELTEKEKDELKQTYVNILNLAKENNIKEIAIPTISTGVFHFPKKDASLIAIDTCLKYKDDFDRIIFCVFDKDDYKYYKSELKKREISV